MDKSQLLEATLKHVPPDLHVRDFNRRFEQYVQSHPEPYYEQDMAGALAEPTWIVRNLDAPLIKPQRRDGDLNVPLTNEARALTRDRLLTIDRSVQQVRREIFGSNDVPCADLASAVKWIRNEVVKHKRPQADPARRSRLQKDLIRLRNQYEELTDLDLKIDQVLPTLPYQSEGRDHAVTIAVPRSATKLLLLGRTAAQLATATGFATDALVTYILTGAEPELRPVKGTVTHLMGIRLPDGTATHRSFATVTINVPALSVRQVRGWYKALQSEWKSPRPRGLTAQQAALQRAVEKAKPPSRKGQQPRLKEYWDQIRRKTGYPNWRAAMMAHRRLEGRAS